MSQIVMLSAAKHLSTPRHAVERSFGHRKSGGLRMTGVFAFNRLSPNQET